MVFYVIACSLANQEEPDLERFVVSSMGPPNRPLGEVYTIEVSIIFQDKLKDYKLSS